MNRIVSKIKWIMLVSGVLTFTMIFAAVAPDPFLRATFGETIEGPVANIIVRNWGALVAMVGALLIYGAFHPVVRSLVLVVAGVSKILFISLVLVSGRQFLSHQVGVSIIVDSIMVVLFAVYFICLWRNG